MFNNPQEGRLARKIFALIALAFIFQFVLGSFIIYQVAIRQSVDFLQQVTKRIQQDISYKNNSWDTHRYIADPDAPGTSPVYILSADGFVIDRWKPIHGFLDTSDVRRLLSYETPQTVTTPTNQTWRILSTAVNNKNELLGIITVAYFNPSQANILDVDTTLKNSISTILSKIKIKNNTIDTSNLDVRDITFGVALQISDKFNRIIVKSNNTNSIDQIPNYIDTSYVGSVANGSSVRQVQDTVTNENYLLVSTPIFDGSNYIIGVIVVGRSISYITDLVYNFIVAEITLGIVLTLILTVIFRNVMQQYALSISAGKTKKEIQHIAFNKKTGKLSFDNESINIPYATNQYYLCEALFSAPNKRWEIDELLERFGEQNLGNWRKVYDTMLMINKKASKFIDAKLIVAHEKTYRINPTLISKVQTT